MNAILRRYDVVIVGAGPAGLFAAYELTKKNRVRVLILDKGNSLDHRKRAETVCGVGGSGTFSDGKLHFSIALSHEKLLDLFSVEEYQRAIEYVDRLFTDFGVRSPYTPDNHDEAISLIKHCQRKGVNLYLRRCRHVGSDFLPRTISIIVQTLTRQGVRILPNTTIDEIEASRGRVTGLRSGNKIFHAKNYLIAPGRVGTSWLQNQAKKIGLTYSYQKIEIGVRVEFPSGIMEDHSRIMHENIYSVRTPTYDDVVRTLCPCPYGRVAIEDYREYVCVNGYSDYQKKTANSNFNLTTEVQLTDPVENTTDYGISIAKLATTIGGGKPLIQRLADLHAGRRSTWERIKRSYVIPTLQDVTPGDISMALPHRIVTDILDGLRLIDKVLPGLNNGETLLYAPEVKLRGNRIKVNRKMQSEIDNLFVAGDGAGVSGNIVGAAISGIFAARGIELLTNRLPRD